MVKKGNKGQLDCATSQTLPLQPTSRGSGKTALAVGGDWIVQYNSTKDFYLQSIDAPLQELSEKADLSPVSQLSTDGTNICATSSKSINCGPLRLQSGSQRDWIYSSSNIQSTAMAANSTAMYGLSKSNILHVAKVDDIMSGKDHVYWNPVARAPVFTSIAYDGKRVCGIKKAETVIACTTNDLATPLSPTWSQLPESDWTSLALSNNQIYAVNAAYAVKRIAAPTQ
ncbi:hypothetical protein SDRG_15474 [Saprolegnia diclina VS20]|uniref:Uncharacterized protein n=1 Tax=Saprolegnia diclina (strain VS20) TaxID=1156394 RepID=T0PMP8_SAPDV|nr:hypothetical protein SDRG_15474 [Saprolegnia diclina VS20]EQC26689.1 hypothetical protein SDRG_15474 [Saprolegnia diclina VS20]|eukprot:XP_008619871.1 hypothetical protein SDRG_15474 [Saprolegnia diclina VS20]